MSILSRLIAVGLWGVATAVALQYMFNDLYAEVSGTVWEIVDYGMAAALVVSLIALAIRKLETPGGRDVSREYVESNVLFYVGLAVTLMFFSAWVNLLTIAEGESQGTSTLVVWSIVDAVMVPVVGATGCYLWRRDQDW